MSKVIYVFFSLMLLQGCCSSRCSINNFAQTSRVLFGSQIKESFKNAPVTIYNIGQMLKGDGSSFVRTSKIAYNVGKGDYDSMRFTARMVKEQWNESIGNFAETAKELAHGSCSYCEKR